MSTSKDSRTFQAVTWDRPSPAGLLLVITLGFIAGFLCEKVVADHFPYAFETTSCASSTTPQSK